MSCGRCVMMPSSAMFDPKETSPKCRELSWTLRDHACDRLRMYRRAKGPLGVVPST